MNKKYIALAIGCSVLFFSEAKVASCVADLRRPVISTIQHDVNGNLDTTVDTNSAFRNGLRFGSQFNTTPSFLGSTHSFAYDIIGDGFVKFMVKALVPTTKNIATKSDFGGNGVIMKADSKNFGVNFKIQNVNADGTLAPTYTTISRNSANVTFHPLVKLYLTDNKPSGTDVSVPTPSDPLQFSFGALQKVYTFFTTESNLRILPTVRGFIMGHIPNADLNNKIKFSNQDIGHAYGVSGTVSSSNFYGFDSVGTHINLKNEGIAADLPMAFSSKLSYDMADVDSTSRVVTTPGGNLGSEIEGSDLFTENIGSAIGAHIGKTNAIVIGADIEGQILTKSAEQYILREDIDGLDTEFIGESRMLRIGGINTVDIREPITKNAFELKRGLANKTNYDLNNIDFTTEKVWYFEGGTVKLSGTVTGVGTIVIEDGNLFITDNLQYANKTNDSLGVILINSQPSEKPSVGNVFVKETVKNMVGTYFADGSLISTDANASATPAISDSIDRSDTLVFGEQLLLEGTIFTRNTMGGAFMSEGTYYTPWGAETDRAEAQKYDLHFIRRYQPPTNGSGGFILTVPANSHCVPQGSVCDRNNHAFVVRADGKVKNITPPGFDVHKLQ